MTGFRSLSVMGMADPELGGVPIATDGFFAIQASVSLLTAEEALGKIELAVTDESGARVPGKLELLWDRFPYIYGWSASAPLEVGSTLRASLSATPLFEPEGLPIGGGFALRVGGERTGLPEPKFSFLNWFDFFTSDDRARVDCETDVLIPSCPPAYKVDVPVTVGKQAAGEVHWQVPAVTGSVAWLAHIEPASLESDAIFLNGGWTAYFGSAPAGSGLRIDRIRFPTPAVEYCATLVVKDLRTGEERRSEHCAPAEPAQGAETNIGLGRCLEPPNEALTEAWCRLRDAARDLEICEPFFRDLPGASGSGGSGSGTTAPVEVPASSGAEADRSSQGCQLGGGGGSASPTAWPAMILGLLAPSTPLGPTRQGLAPVRPSVYGPDVQ